MNPLLLFAIGQLGDIVIKALTKKPELTPIFSPLLNGLVTMASQAAGETQEETAARRSAHEALIKQFAAAPPAAATPKP
jgi:hypothetical protein